MPDKPKEEKKPTCFVVMPISTPPELVEQYGNDEDHFGHVLEDLFTPAIEAAGFTVVPPISKGSEIIHADIIENLVKADLVFVDMSTLNANVFFEFGIRTALNKPVCLVRDDKTPKVPFDAGTANNHPYLSALGSWIVKKEIPKIAEHVRNAYARSNNQNALWKFFGANLVGEPPKAPSSADEKLDLILNSLPSVTRDRTVGVGVTRFKRAGGRGEIDHNIPIGVLKNISATLSAAQIDYDWVHEVDGVAVIGFEKTPNPSSLAQLASLVSAYDVPWTIEVGLRGE